jgi:xanthine dehydrogenase accessory factor
MNPIIDHLTGWLTSGGSGILATLVRVDGSAPQPPGAMLAVGPDGDIIGTVAGGCVDSAIVDLADDFGEGTPPRLIEFSVDDGPWAVGPVCGGRLTVLVEGIQPQQLGDWQVIAEELHSNRPVARLSKVDADPASGSTLIRNIDIAQALWRWHGPGSGAVREDGAVAEHVLNLLRGRHRGSAAAGLIATAEGRLVVQVWTRRNRLIVVGADAIALAVCQLGADLGFAVTVCDPRPAFTRAARFPAADEIVTGWPQDYISAEAVAGRLGPDAAVSVLTHDERVEIPTLLACLEDGRAGFIGALGSRATHERRRTQLLAAGADADLVGSIRGPLGLDLGARDPAAVALSVVAEIVGWQHGGTGRPLADLSGPMHEARPCDTTARGLPVIR